MAKNEKEAEAKLSSDWDGIIIPQDMIYEQTNKLSTRLLFHFLAKRPYRSRDC